MNNFNIIGGSLALGKVCKFEYNDFITFLDYEVLEGLF